MFSVLKKIFGSAQDRMVRRYSKLVSEVNHFDAQFQSLTDSELKAKTEEFKQRLAQGASVDDILCEAYGVVKAACRRLIGQDVHVSGYNQKWDMVPYDVQLIGAIAMHHGSIAEMMTINSSPPARHTTSSFLMSLSRRFAVAIKTASPAECPK